MKKQKSRPKAHSRKSGKSRIAKRNIRKPKQKIRNTHPDNLPYPNEVNFLYFYEEDIIAVFEYLGLSFDKGARGEPLGRPDGPKVGGASLVACPRCSPPKAEGQGPLSGLDPLPSGERLPSLFDFQRGVACNTPLHDYRGNIK